jgi:hypothetical protein
MKNFKKFFMPKPQIAASSVVLKATTFAAIFLFFPRNASKPLSYNEGRRPNRKICSETLSAEPYAFVFSYNGSVQQQDKRSL